MSYNLNMNRWIMASCRTWFENNKQNNIKIFYEYFKHKDVTEQQYAEFRLNGPDYQLITKSEGRYDVDINLLVTQVLNDGNTDEIELLIGSIAVCFAECIPVYKYGSIDNLVNDGSLIGNLVRVNEKNGEVNVSRFGQANPDTLISQASIDSRYTMRLFTS